MKEIKLWYWKWRLKKAYMRYIEDEADYGQALGDYISGRKSAVNEIIKKVNALDPEANLNLL